MEQNQNIVLTPRKYINNFSKFHLSFTIAPSLFACVAYYLNSESYLDYMETSDPLFYIVPLVAIAGIAFGNMLYAKNIKDLLNKKTLKEKFAGLQTTYIVRYATIEGPALLGLIAFYKTGNLFYLIIAVMLIIYLFLQRPSKAQIEQDLQLNYELKSQFNQMDREID